MKTLTGLLSLAIVSSSLTSSLSARADTDYHAVYRMPITATDPFSILDKYQNNVLSPAEFNGATRPETFASLDNNNDGFIDRLEYYRQNLTAYNNQSGDGYNSIAPAMGMATHKYFSDNDRVMLRTYVANKTDDTGRYGMTTYYEPGTVLPKTVTYTKLPSSVTANLMAPPKGYEYTVIKGNAYLVNKKKRVILDATRLGQYN